jgi:hypothetical protein
MSRNLKLELALEGKTSRNGGMNLPELKSEAKKMGIKLPTKAKRAEVVALIKRFIEIDALPAPPKSLPFVPDRETCVKRYNELNAILREIIEMKRPEGNQAIRDFIKVHLLNKNRNGSSIYNVNRERLLDCAKFLSTSEPDTASKMVRLVSVMDSVVDGSGGSGGGGMRMPDIILDLPAPPMDAPVTSNRKIAVAIRG